jgi:predicted SnoaL-like aldol condensation-catalyzing enzyme
VTKEIEMRTLHRPQASFLAIVVVLALALFAPAAVNVHATSTSDVESNKVLALRYQHEILEQGNLAAVDEILAPDFVWHYPADQSFAVGPEAVKQQATALRSLFAAGIVLTDDDVIAAGDRVVIRWTMVGLSSGEARNVPVTVTGIDIFRVTDGQVAELWQQFGELGREQWAARSTAFLP